MTGYDSKRQMAVDKVQEPVANSFEEYCKTLPPLWNTHISRTYAEQFFRAGQAAQPAQEPVNKAASVWQMFPGYLIENCEGHTITEEGLQRALADMLANPEYTTPPTAQPAQKPSQFGSPEMQALIVAKALAQPAQEPVGHFTGKFWNDDAHNRMVCEVVCNAIPTAGAAIYTTPPAAQPAQEPYDQTALELCEVCGWKTLIPDDGCLNCERVQPAQEPVALVIDGVLVKSELPEKYTGHLYTAPPKREWVGLTSDEIYTEGGKHEKFAKNGGEWFDRDSFARAIEAKLKEKNT